MNFTVLFNDTKVEGLSRLVKGNYSFVAISKYGTDVKEFSAVLIGEALYGIVLKIKENHIFPKDT